MDSELTPRQKAEAVVRDYYTGAECAEPIVIDAITTAIQQQSNEDLARHREKRAALETELAAANERCAELVAGLEGIYRGACRQLAEPANHGDDQATLQAIATVAEGVDFPAILAAVREKASREGALEKLKWVRSMLIAAGGRTYCEDSASLMLLQVNREIAALEAKG